MHNRRPHYAVAALTVASLLIRTAIAFRGGLWRDEALFLGVVNLPSWNSMFDFLRFHESHPPLFYAMLRIWLGVFGDSDAAALSLPILLGVALVPATYAVGSSLFGSRTGLIAAVLVSFAPRVSEYGSMVRPYSFLALGLVLSMFALVRAVEAGGIRRWSAYALSLIALVLAHNWAWLIVAGQAASMLFLVGRGPRYRRDALTGFVLSVLAACVVYLPWLPPLAEQVRVAGHSPLPTESLLDAVILVAYAVFSTANATVLYDVETERWLVVALAAIATGIMIWGRGRHHSVSPTSLRTQSGHPSAKPLLLWTSVTVVAVATAISPRTNMLVGACLSSLTPVVVILLAHQASRMIEQSGHDVTRMRLAIVLSAGSMLAGAYTAGIHHLVTHPRSNAREIVRQLEARELPGDVLLIVPGWLVSSVDHYYRGSMRQIAYPDSGGSTLFDFSRLWERMGDTSALADARNSIAETARRTGRVWLLTDVASTGPVSDSDRQYAGSHRVAPVMARVRLADLRATLNAAFGPPAARIRVHGATPTWEEVHVELYARGAGGTSTVDNAR